MKNYLRFIPEKNNAFSCTTPPSGVELPGELLKYSKVIIDVMNQRHFVEKAPRHVIFLRIATG